MKTSTLLATVMATGIIVTAGCGGAGTITTSEPQQHSSPSPRTAPQFLKSSASTTAQVSKYRYEMTFDHSGRLQVGAGVSGELAGTTSHLSLNLDLNNASGANGHGVKVEMITTPEATYVRGGMFGAVPDASGASASDWYRLGSNDDQKFGEQLGGIGLPQLKVSDLLDLIKRADGQVAEVGTEVVRGVSTRHLNVTVNLEKLANEAATQPDDHSALDAMLPNKDVTLNVWADDENLIRKIQAGSANGVGLVTVELFDFDAEIQIDIPTNARELSFGSVFDEISKGIGGN